MTIIVFVYVNYIYLSDRRIYAIVTLRALYFLKPLQKIVNNQQFILICNVLFQIIPMLTGLVIIAGLLVWVLSVIFVKFFRGTFCYCDSLPSVNRQSCIEANANWLCSSSNFDNVLNASFLILKIILGDNFTMNQFQCVDSNGVD